MAPQEILIIGAGVAGPTLASLLLLSHLPSTQKPRITILERASAIRKQGQNVDIRPAGLPVLRHLGLEKVIRSSTTGEIGVQHVDASNRVWGAIEARPDAPTSDIEILRGTLAEICWRRSVSISEKVRAEGGAGIEYIFGDYVEELVQDGDKVRVKLAKSGATRAFDIVVGADGLQSKTRALAWGAEGEGKRLKGLGGLYGGFFSIPRIKTDTQWRRWFHAPGRKGIMLRPDDTGERTTVLMMVLSEDDTRLRDAAGYGPAAVDVQKRLLEEYFRDEGWECERIVREMWATNDFYYDMCAQVKMDSWSKGRVVLLGDAGYCASPISGKGTTLALNGAYHLAGALTRSPDDHTRAFAEYETHMKPIVEGAQKLVPGVPHLFCPETWWGVWALQIFIWVISASGVGTLLFKVFGGKKPVEAEVEDYGFERLPEWDG